MNLGNIIEKEIKEKVDQFLKNESQNKDFIYIATDSIGEVIEKLVILHIRIWMLEDSIDKCKDDSSVAEVKKKLDICFKIKRPKLVQAINCLIDDAINNYKSLKEDSVKIYKGINN